MNVVTAVVDGWAWLTDWHPQAKDFPLPRTWYAATLMLTVALLALVFYTCNVGGWRRPPAKIQPAPAKARPTRRPAKAPAKRD